MRIKIHLQTITDNARTVTRLCAEHGITVIGVTKSCCGINEVGLEWCATKVLEQVGRADVTISGPHPLPWVCRIRGCGRVVDVLGVKRAIGLTFGINLAVGSFVTITLPSLVIPFSGFLL